MYRVELKGQQLLRYFSWVLVPNVPCGVESKTWHTRPNSEEPPVPNVPCGVESPTLPRRPFGVEGFLMYRVELKDL